MDKCLIGNSESKIEGLQEKEKPKMEYSNLEKQIQKYEEEIRDHIRTEQQMSLQTEYLLEQIEELQQQNTGVKIQQENLEQLKIGNQELLQKYENLEKQNNQLIINKESNEELINQLNEKISSFQSEQLQMQALKKLKNSIPIQMTERYKSSTSQIQSILNILNISKEMNSSNGCYASTKNYQRRKQQSSVFMENFNKTKSDRKFKKRKLHDLNSKTTQINGQNQFNNFKQKENFQLVEQKEIHPINQKSYLSHQLSTRQKKQKSQTSQKIEANNQKIGKTLINSKNEPYLNSSNYLSHNQHQSCNFNSNIISAENLNSNEHKKRSPKSTPGIKSNLLKTVLPNNKMMQKCSSKISLNSEKRKQENLQILFQKYIQK